MESDFSNAVQWILDPEKAPWKLRNHIMGLERWKGLVERWKVTKIPREINEMVDELAKSGLRRTEDVLRVLD